jgi:hypothetical protein
LPSNVPLSLPAPEPSAYRARASRSGTVCETNAGGSRWATAFRGRPHRGWGSAWVSVHCPASCLCSAARPLPHLVLAGARASAARGGGPTAVQPSCRPQRAAGRPQQRAEAQQLATARVRQARKHWRWQHDAYEAPWLSAK